MFRISPIRYRLMTLGVVLLSISGSAQDRSWGVGTDGVLWATGWSQVQVAHCFTDEFRLQAGFGVLRGVDLAVSSFQRPRPGTFDRAGIVSLGLRANPGVVDGRPFRGLIGVEWSSETYVKSALAEWGTVGTMKWSRRDARLLAGAEWSFDSGWGMSIHAGVGHSGTQGEGFDAELTRRVANSPGVTRMFGFELMKWF
jgi:hypothetical protein